MSVTIKRIRTNELSRHMGTSVELVGWIQARRNLGKVCFTILRDGWGERQVVSDENSLPPDVPCESAVRVQGKVVAAAGAPGGVELHATSWAVISAAETPPFSLAKRELKVSPHTCQNFAALTLRHPTRRQVFAIAAKVVQAFRRTLDMKGFIEIFSPKISGGTAEGGANVFSLDYFGKPAFLVQSPQLYKQMMVGVYERVYEVGPVFRAEPHDTSRHLNQYTSLDAEMGFIESYQEIMDLVEVVVASMVDAAQQANGDYRSLECRRPFPVLPFWEAVHIFHQEYGRSRTDEADLSPQDERLLGQWAKDNHGSDFLFIAGYPLRKRPFYTAPDPLHPGYSQSFDLLYRGLEIVTGGRRLHRWADYMAALKEREIDPEPFQSYLDTFRYGMPPHGGFAIGLERFVAQFAELESVREASLFPRTMDRLQP